MSAVQEGFTYKLGDLDYETQNYLSPHSSLFILI